MSTAAERMYRPHPERWPDSGYLLFPIDDGWRWLWGEPGEVDEISPHFDSRADALRSIAADWEEHGGERLPRFVGMLRGLAKREEASS